MTFQSFGRSAFGLVLVFVFGATTVCWLMRAVPRRGVYTLPEPSPLLHRWPKKPFYRRMNLNVDTTAPLGYSKLLRWLEQGEPMSPWIIHPADRLNALRALVAPPIGFAPFFFDSFAANTWLYGIGIFF